MLLTYFVGNLCSRACRRMQSISINQYCQFSSEYLQSGSVYIHWPYCAKKCTYCDFNKYVSDSVDHSRMQNCLVEELSRQLNLSQIRKITTVFFGGGTPSLAKPATVQVVLAALSKHLTADAEVTLEANPTSSPESTLQAFHEAGITRLSIGVQSLNDQELQWLGRDHTAAAAEACLRSARRIFPRVSADLLIGRPAQTAARLRSEVRRLAALCPDHVSVYQLTVHRGTALHRQVSNGHVTLPCSDQQAELYSAAADELAQAGLRQYEVSNFARAGCQCQHNGLTWRGRQYLGVGPGAHGRVVSPDGSARRATVQHPSPERWMRAVEAGAGGCCVQRDQSPAEVRAELLVTGLRMRRGLSAGDWRAAGGTADTWRRLTRHADVLTRLRPLLTLSADGRRLTTTRRGLALLDALLPELLNVVDADADCEAAPAAR